MKKATTAKKKGIHSRNENLFKSKIHEGKIIKKRKIKNKSLIQINSNEPFHLMDIFIEKRHNDHPNQYRVYPQPLHH